MHSASAWDDAFMEGNCGGTWSGWWSWLCSAVRGGVVGILGAARHLVVHLVLRVSGCHSKHSVQRLPFPSCTTWCPASSSTLLMSWDRASMDGTVGSSVMSGNGAIPSSSLFQAAWIVARRRATLYATPATLSTWASHTLSYCARADAMPAAASAKWLPNQSSNDTAPLTLLYTMRGRLPCTPERCESSGIYVIPARRRHWAQTQAT